jgi:dipeptidyl aminopeptidase/acylaminoacyl peptidase
MTLSARKAALGALGIGVALGGGWLSSKQSREWTPAPPGPHLAKLVEELTHCQDDAYLLAPSPSGTALAFTRDSQYGHSLVVVDLKTLKQTVVPVTNTVRRPAGWSPDGRYVAFEQEPPFSARALAPTRWRGGFGNRSEAWLTIFDSWSNAVQRLTANRRVNERWFEWLTPKTFFFDSDSDDNAVRGTYWGNVAERKVRRVSPTAHCLLRMSDVKGAYLKNQNVWSFEVEIPSDSSTEWGRPRLAQVSHFMPNQFDALQWVRYCAHNDSFLFCARPANSTWRYLFKYAVADGQPTQLNQEDTYNGQWLEQGRGFAYVANTNNSFHLAIRTESPEGWTNLFTEGSVLSYAATPAGDQVFVSGSVGMEPQGIWEYDLGRKSLRPVVSCMGSGSVCHVVVPQERRVKSFDGVEIPCFIFPPPALARARPSENGAAAPKKYPVVIYLPPSSAQFQRRFEARSQLMANVGFYYVAVNYRGCDGYGREYAGLQDAAGAARDVLAVYEELRKDPAVDTRNVFLCTLCSVSTPGLELLATAPELWRGAIFSHPAGWSEDGRYQPKQFPPLLITNGDQDNSLPSTKEFKSWADVNGVEAKLVVYRNMEHVLGNQEQFGDDLRLGAQFFLDHLKQ